MKTIKFLLSMIGCTLTFVCFAQQLPQDNSDKLFYSAYYNSEDNRFEHQVHKYPERTTSGDYFEKSVISRKYYAAVDTHIESNLNEQEVMLESWMLSPFESSYSEPEIPVESWMTVPFKTAEVFEDELVVEEWMTTPWV